ncbi:MAG: hypothetical protein AAF487_11340, partial [Bacteroidota bacterium]
FNYGMKGMVFDHLEPLLEIELAKERKTPIILDFHHLFFLTHENMPLQMSNYVPFIDNPQISQFLKDRNLYKNYLRIPGLRYYGCYMDYLKEYLRFHKKKSIVFSKGGAHSPTQSEEHFKKFIEKRSLSSQKLKDLERKKDENSLLFSVADSLMLNRLNSLLRFSPDHTKTARFNEMLEDNRDRKFILVFSPQHFSKLDGIDNYDQMIWFIEDLKQKNENLEFINYAYENYPNSYFRDTGHLSISGAQAFSGRLNQDLKSILKN